MFCEYFGQIQLLFSMVGYGAVWFCEYLAENSYVGWLWEIAVISICMHRQRVALQEFHLPLKNDT